MYYVSCPDCRTRMKRTGKKQKEQEALSGDWLYQREYKCGDCGRFFVYSELKNWISKGPLT